MTYKHYIENKNIRASGTDLISATQISNAISTYECKANNKINNKITSWQGAQDK